MHANRRLLVSFVALAAPLSACGQEAAEAAHPPPAVVEEIGDGEIARITLTPKAAERLGIETAPVERSEAGLTAVPYGAVFYGTSGETWLYVSPEPLVFAREPIVVERIDGENALLTEGPPIGTHVATVGVAELFGTETGIGGSGH
jgi:hypothetical protein